jgi:hypothetical protein
MTWGATLSTADTRRQWAAALFRAGLFQEALHLWPDVTGSDTVRRAQLALLAGDPPACQRLLAEHSTDAATEPDARLLQACVDVLTGRQPMTSVMDAAGRIEPSAHVSWLIAIALARQDLSTAGRAAVDALDHGAVDLQLVSVAAAALAQAGEYLPALALLEDPAHRGAVADDPAGPALTLLADVGADGAAAGLAALATHITELPAERRAVWKEHAHRVVPRPKMPPWAQLLAWCALALILAIPLKVGGPLLAMGARLGWQRWRPLPGMDRQTSQLVRSHHHGSGEAMQFHAIDVITFLAGCTIGFTAGSLAAVPFSGPEGYGRMNAGAIGALICAPALVWGRRAALRRLADARKARERDVADRALDCRCWGAEGWAGPRSRHYVEHHLIALPGPVDERLPGRLLQCPRTGLLFLDVPGRPATVGVPKPQPEADTPPPPGFYL